MDTNRFHFHPHMGRSGRFASCLVKVPAAVDLTYIDCGLYNNSRLLLRSAFLPFLPQLFVLHIVIISYNL